MTQGDNLTVLDRQLLLQLGDRLKRLRKGQGISAVELSKRVGISRTTLTAVEAGDPAPTMGTYLRVMSSLGVSAELALLASDTLTPAQPGTAAAQTRQASPVISLHIASDPGAHRLQDLQSLSMHHCAIQAIERDPALLVKAKNTVNQWLQSHPNSRTASLWRDWAQMLQDGTWKKMQGSTQRGQQLRQASPLPTVLPESVRQDVLAQVQALKRGVTLDNQFHPSDPE